MVDGVTGTQFGVDADALASERLDWSNLSQGTCIWCFRALYIVGHDMALTARALRHGGCRCSLHNTVATPCRVLDRKSHGVRPF